MFVLIDEEKYLSEFGLIALVNVYLEILEFKIINQLIAGNIM